MEVGKKYANKLSNKTVGISILTTVVQNSRKKEKQEKPVEREKSKKQLVHSVSQTYASVRSTHRNSYKSIFVLFCMVSMF